MTGPLPNLPSSVPKYFISFINEDIRFHWVYPLCSKDSTTVTPIFTILLKLLKLSSILALNVFNSIVVLNIQMVLFVLFSGRPVYLHLTLLRLIPLHMVLPRVPTLYS